VRSKKQPDVREQPTFTEAARRVQIVQCAIETIAELGYERASLAEIAKRARISKSVVSYYFATKDDLMDQVVTHVYKLGGDYMRPYFEAQSTALGTLRAFILGNTAFIASHARDVQALIEIVSSSRLPDGRPRFGISSIEQSVSDIEGLMRWGQKTGEFRKFSPNIMAIAIRVTVDALGPHLLAHPDLDPEAYGREIADLFENATKATKRKS
jgi:AcrR family transcriptional regulator